VICLQFIFKGCLKYTKEACDDVETASTLAMGELWLDGCWRYQDFKYK